MSNPNNCETCEHKQRARKEDGWCYMFRDEPKEICMQHTARFLSPKEQQTLIRLLGGFNYKL